MDRCGRCKDAKVQRPPHHNPHTTKDRAPTTGKNKDLQEGRGACEALVETTVTNYSTVCSREGRERRGGRRGEGEFEPHSDGEAGIWVSPKSICICTEYPDTILKRKRRKVPPKYIYHTN